MFKSLGTTSPKEMGSFGPLLLGVCCTGVQAVSLLALQPMPKFAKGIQVNNKVRKRTSVMESTFQCVMLLCCDRVVFRRSRYTDTNMMMPILPRMHVSSLHRGTACTRLSSPQLKASITKTRELLASAKSWRIDMSIKQTDSLL
jgi:hypothetical protein